ncbi:hypothetical protein [Gordonia alkaliphila]|uniref:Uncharacterized protein n=1 Tax=Gordonia alkaliphila TaxID=1053547 RepID=A0ABP8ZK71_9ACTN
MSTELTAAQRRARRARVLRSILPGLATILVVAVIIWTFTAFTIVFPESGVWERILSTLVGFSGGYIPPGIPAPQYDTGLDAIPTTMVAIPLTVAFGITLFAAASLVIVMTRRARNAVRVWFARPRLTVIGSGTTATAIVQSAATHRIRTVLVSTSEDTPAAAAAYGAVPVLTVPNFDAPETSAGLTRLARRAHNVVIATDSASENLRIRKSLARHRDSLHLDEFRSLLAVVQDPQLAGALRPTELGSAFPDEDVTCPSENVAERVCHLIDEVTTGPRLIFVNDEEDVATHYDEVLIEIVDVELTPYDSESWFRLAETIRLWATRLSWGRVFLRGDERTDGLFNPIVPIRVLGPDESLPPAADRERVFGIRIYAGSPTATVTQMLDDQLTAPQDRAGLTILVADQETARAAGADDSEGAVAVVDPVTVGLDANLVVDAVTLQWARMFDQTHKFMFAGDYSVVAWEPGAPLGDTVSEAAEAAVRRLRAQGAATEEEIAAARHKVRKGVSGRYSSYSAVKNMLTFLDQHGYELVRCPRDLTNPPVAPDFPDDVVNQIAAAEHEDWRVRTWVDHSRLTRLQRFLRRPAPVEHTKTYSNSGVDKLAFDELDTPTANYNRRIVTETYPAIAAAAGYAIVPRNTSPFPSTDSDDSATWWTYPRRPTKMVRAARRDEAWAWKTTDGQTLHGDAGDWRVTELNGSNERSVAADKFPHLYRPVDGHPELFYRMGSVVARRAIPGEVVVSDEGEATACPGNWLVQGELGERWLVPGLHFSGNYLSRGPNSEEQ